MYPMTVKNGYLPDPRSLEQLITPKTKMIILCNPGNPTGAVWPAETVKSVMDLAAKHDLYVLSDEIYEELVFDGAHVPAASFDDDNRVITVSGFSKTYAMTGWRLGWAIADAPILTMINKMLEPLISCPSSISQQAGIAALNGTQQPVGVMREAYRKRRDLAAEISGTCGIAPGPSQRRLLRDRRSTRNRIGRPGSRPGSPGRAASCRRAGDTFGEVLANGFLRISLASSDDDVGEGCRRLIAFRNEHRQ